MRKIFYLLVTIALFASCTDLDLEPHQSLSPAEAYESYSDCENAARGLYLRATSVYGDDYILISDAFCDNLISFSAGRQSYSTFKNWDMSSGSNYMWTSPYKCIVNCNLLLESMKIPEGDEAAKFNSIKAEALAMRAIMHFELAKQHGRRYIGATESDLGIPYVTSTASSNLPARESLISNFKNITDDLKAALDLIGASTKNDRLNKTAIAGFLSRVYLYMGEYDNSITYAETALTGATICPMNKFKGVWLDESQDGVMFNLVVTSKEKLKVGDFFNQFLNDAYKSEFVAPKSFASLYDQVNDIRFKSYFQKSAFNALEAYHVIKWVGLADDAHERNKVSLKVMRAAEMYLNIAESSLRSTTKNEAKANLMLSTLLTNRVEGYVHADLAGAALLAEVMKQRRLELAIEWDRYSTLKRLGLGVHRLAGEGDLSDGTGRENLETVLEADDFKWSFPILQSEIDANENMVQNAGY